MRATVMFGAGDVGIETVPDACLIELTDGLVRVTRAATKITAQGARYPERLEQLIGR